MTDPLKSWPWPAKMLCTVAVAGLGGFFVAGKVYGDRVAAIEAVNERVSMSVVRIEEVKKEAAVRAEKLEKAQQGDHDVLLRIDTHVAILVKSADSQASLAAELRALREDLRRAAPTSAPK